MILGDWWRQLCARDDRRLRALMRPELGRTPQPVRRILEPMIAVVAAAVLIWLAVTGAVAMAALFAVLGLAYLILTHVFGLHLELSTP